MNYIFTDIDGVFNTGDKNKWNRESIYFYNKLCHEFSLKPVIISSWRKNHTKSQLQSIFTIQGITVPIYDFAPYFPDEGRGAEIEHWLFKNSYDKFVIIDDNIKNIELLGIPNIVKCSTKIGFSENEYNIAKKILNRL